MLTRYLRNWARIGLVAALGVAAVSGVACSSAKEDGATSGAASCGIKVDNFKEVLVIEPSVLSDPRTLNASAGPWSFRHLIENLTPPGKSSSAFVTEWLRTWVEQTEYNGHPLDLPNERRDETMNALIICPWLHRTPANACDTNCGTCASRELDMSLAPFRLIGISNRIDLRTALRTNEPTPAGEGRLVYALTAGAADDPASAPQSMTVIFEYAQPSSRSAKEWAQTWHHLGTHAAFDEGYKAELEALTESFTVRGVSPERPLGSAISQVRTNESVLNWIWQLREFRYSSGSLVVHGTANTPFDSLNNTEALGAWAKENSAAIKTGNFIVPVSFLGGSADQFLFTWTLPGVDEETRRAFAKETCSGCHTGDPPGQGHRDVAFHISPYGEGPARLSPFLYDPEHKFTEPGKKDALTVRNDDMLTLLCEP